MDDFCTEVGKLGCFFVGYFLDGFGLGNESGVGGHDAGYIGPNLYLFGSQGGTHDACGVVRASPAQGSGNSGFGCSYESLGDDDVVFPGLDGVTDFFVALGFQEVGCGKVLVGNDAVAAVGELD